MPDDLLTRTATPCVFATRTDVGGLADTADEVLADAVRRWYQYPSPLREPFGPEDDPS